MRYEQKSGTEGAAEGVTDFVIVQRVSQFKYLAYLKKKKNTNIQNANKHIPLSVQQP